MRRARGCSAAAIPIAARRSIVDGRIGIDYGVYGVPETFVIDRAGPHPLQAYGPDHGRASGATRLLPVVRSLQ